MNWAKDVKEACAGVMKLLLFKPVKLDMERFGTLYLGIGIFSAWLAGVGRYWDNPRASLWQYAGLGSVVYIFILAFILWLIIKPLKPENWSYLGVVTFVGLTSPPGWLYAIPVERFFTLSTAAMINVWFLAVVALWRVILLFLYLKRAARLSWGVVVVAASLPLMLVIVALSALNLEHVIFRIMAGLAENEKSANDAAYMVLLAISFFSMYVAPVALIAYGFLVVRLRAKNADA